MSINRAISRLIGGIIAFVMNQLLHLVYILFLLAGILCAIVSGIIEYHVFAGLYAKIDAPGPFSFSIACLIVSALETAKVFLVFFHKQAVDTANEAYLNDRPKFTLLRNALIMISAVCTLIFSFYCLHNPEYETRRAQIISQANAEYQNRLSHIRNEFDRQMTGIGQEVTRWRQRLSDETQQVSNGISEGPRYKAYEKQYDQALQRLDMDRTRLERERFQHIQALENSHEEKIAQLEAYLKSDPSVHNKFLSATLLVLNMNADYPQWQYIALIFFLSLLLSLALEGIIVCSFKVLAIYHGNLFELDLHRKTSEQTFKNLSETADQVHQVELKSFRKRIIEEKENALNTLKSFEET